MFRVGQKVMCVDADCMDNILEGIPARIVEGAIYSVTWCGQWKGKTCVRLAGIIRNREEPHYKNWPFAAYRFRPIVEKSTDAGMAILREILDRESFDEKTPEHHKAR